MVYFLSILAVAAQGRELFDRNEIFIKDNFGFDYKASLIADIWTIKPDGSLSELSAPLFLNIEK